LPYYRWNVRPGLDDPIFRAQREAMADRKPGLDDPDYAAFAWRRYWRLMRWMGVVAVLCVATALTLLWRRNGGLPIHFIIATTAGIGFSVMLMAGLMGLVFLSSGTGHDEKVEDRLGDEYKRGQDDE
jgi:hypothetical protein